MTLAQATLPDDAEALRAFALSLQAELYAKSLYIEKLKAQLAVLRRARFGQSSETLDRDIEQLELLIGDLEESDSEAEQSVPVGSAQPAGTPSRRKPGRKPLPEHLPREEIFARAGLHLPGLWRYAVQPDRPGRAGSAGICALLLQGGSPRPAEAELPGLRDDRA